MDQYFATTAQALIDEAIRDAEVLLCIFLRLVVDLQVEVFEISVALSVGLARYVKNMRDANLKQLTCLEGGLERSHVNAREHLEQADVSDSFLAIHIASAVVNMRESAANDLLFLASVSTASLLEPAARLLVVERKASEARVALDLL